MIWIKILLIKDNRMLHFTVTAISGFWSLFIWVCWEFLQMGKTFVSGSYFFLLEWPSVQEYPLSDLLGKCLGLCFFKNHVHKACFASLFPQITVLFFLWPTEISCPLAILRLSGISFSFKTEKTARSFPWNMVLSLRHTKLKHQATWWLC